MNKERRKMLINASVLVEQAKDLIQQACQEEQESFDNMPEGLQEADKGQAMQEAIGLMEQLDSDLEDCMSALNDASA